MIEAFSLGLGILLGLFADRLVTAWDMSDRVGCSFRDALWHLDL